MVKFRIFRGRRKKQKDVKKVKNQETYSLSENRSSSSFSSDDSSYFSSDEESYESEDSYSVDSACIGGNAVCTDGNGASCTGTKNVPDLVKSFTHYASLEIQKTRHDLADLAENMSKTGEEFGKAKGMTKERLGRFREGLDEKFQSIKNSLDLGTDNNESVMARMEKQLQLWKIHANKLERQTAGSNESTEKKNVVARTKPKSKMFARKKKMTGDKQVNEQREPVFEKEKKVVDRQPIEQRDPVATSSRTLTERRQLPDPIEDEAISTTIRSGNKKILVSTQGALPFQNRGRTKSDGHFMKTKKTITMSPRLQSEYMRVQTSLTPKKENTMPPRLASPRVSTLKKEIAIPLRLASPRGMPMSPKKRIVAPKKPGKTVKNDELDDMVAHVIRKRSSEPKLQNSECTFASDWVTFGSEQETANKKVENSFRENRKETDAMAAKKLQEAQREIENLKKLLADKQGHRNNTLTPKQKPKDSASALWVFDDAPFDEGVPDENAISSRTKLKIKTIDNSLESKAYSKKSPLPILEETNIILNPVHELNWDNFVGMDRRVDDDAWYRRYQIEASRGNVSKVYDMKGFEP